MDNCEHILSLNVRGLRDNKKRQELFRWLKKHNNGSKSIIFLQETHSDENDLPIWEREWKSKVIMCNGSKNSRGVAVLLPENFSFNISKIQTDNCRPLKDLVKTRPKLASCSNK